MEEYKLIPLTKGYFAKVDTEDFEWLCRWKWTAYVNDKANKVYAKRVDTSGGGRKLISMHRLLSGAPDGVDADHKNGDSLDNRRNNLRTATEHQNSQNRPAQLNCTSRFKGVKWHSVNKNWLAVIVCDGKSYHLGCFDDEAEAAKQYDRAAIELHGEYARLNFPEVINETIKRPFKVSPKMTSDYRGVSWSQARKMWVAYIKYGDVRRNLGGYVTEEKAARAYDAVARVHHGPKARLNFP